MTPITQPLDYAPDDTGTRVERRRQAQPASYRIPDITLETLGRAFHLEAAKYGFRTVDYVRFVNLLLDRAMQAARSTRHRARLTEARPDRVYRVGGVDPTDLPLKGARVTVRALVRFTDAPLFEQWLKDPLARRFLQSRTSSRQVELHEVMDSESSVFGIIESLSGEPVGCVAFLDYDPTQQKAELRKLIGDPVHRGQGLAREASALWIRYGIETLGLKKIYLSTFETDIRNVRLNEQLGFKVEGVLRGEVVVDGVRKDVLRMGLVVEEHPTSNVQTSNIEHPTSNVQR